MHPLPKMNRTSNTDLKLKSGLLKAYMLPFQNQSSTICSTVDPRLTEAFLFGVWNNPPSPPPGAILGVLSALQSGFGGGVGYTEEREGESHALLVGVLVLASC